MSILGTWVGPGWNPSGPFSPSVPLSIQLHARPALLQRARREGAARTTRQFSLLRFLKYATSSRARRPGPGQGDERRGAAGGGEALARALPRRYDKIIEMVDAEIEKGTSGRLKDPSRASALGLGPIDYKGLRVDLAKRKAEAEALLAQPEDDGEEEEKEEPSTPPREAP